LIIKTFYIRGNVTQKVTISEDSSVGRASVSQTEGRGFEPRFSLQNLIMKNIFATLCLVALSIYAHAQYVDEIAKKLHDPKELRKDVDFARQKLEKEHVNLYKYISKKQLDYKFDSLKQTITQPMISLRFNVKLMSVLSTIGDGHLSSTYDGTKFTKADIDYFQKPKKQPGITTLDYLILNNRLYVKQNNSNDQSIKTGDEILKIENVPVANIIDTMMKAIASDGYNKTFKQFILNQQQFDQYYKFIWGSKDTTRIEIRNNKEIRKTTLKPEEKSNVQINISNTKPLTFKFLKPDSSAAYLKVRTFALDSTFKGFEDVFKTIKQAKSKTLVLDLRGNTGGDIGWSANLFSYLTTTPANYFKRPDELIKNYLIPGLNKLRDKQIKFYQRSQYLNKIIPQHNGFESRLYLLTNGGTFSAASLLTANIKKYRAVTIIGEETGGSRNIWTAGEMKSELLPESKMVLRYGILPFTFGDETDNTGRGIMPDVPLTYTIEDMLANKDLEMDWVTNDIEKIR
jgi:C-terminal processing protease CtpA/Prc